MSSDRRLQTAGLAAELLEQMGFTSVARKKEGVVTLECWRLVGARQYHLSREVSDGDHSPRALAEVCAAEFRAALAHHEP